MCLCLKRLKLSTPINYYTAEYLEYKRLFPKVLDKTLVESRFCCKILWLIIKYTIIYYIMRHA